MDKTVYEFKARTIENQEISLSAYKGKVLLIVNVASQCGFTPQYKALEEIYDKYSPQGLLVLGFPCNQFGGQEPGNEQEIKNFCELNFGVKFPLFSKVEVNGPNALPLYDYLKGNAPGILGTKKIKWNFTKFLVGRDGLLIKRFAPTTKPEKLISEIEHALTKAVI